MTESNYPGACFCEAIGFQYATAVPPQRWFVRACQCLFCRMHDALSCSDPGGELRFTAAQPGHLQRFRFALRTADFLLCRNCGVYIGAVISSDEGLFGIINTRALKPVPTPLRLPEPVHYDNEITRDRIGRRKTRWTPVSQVPW